MPAFPAIAAFVASIVGYPMPVLCQPLTEGTTIGYQVSGKFGTVSLTSRPFVANLAGVMHPIAVPVGDTITVTVGGQTLTLPAAPGDTPLTHEVSGLPAGWVAIPAYIALANCDGWTSEDPRARGQTLITAVHESMHAKFVEGNEALTECRTLQALPTRLAAIWPDAPADPGAEPDQPSVPSRSKLWRRRHPVLWRKLISAYRTSYQSWKAADARWHAAYGEWANYGAILDAAYEMDEGEPPEYHGATC